MSFTIGTHNLHDYSGVPTPFADLIGFTEAIPSTVKACLKHAGYKFVVALRQRDLVVAYNPKVLKKTGLARYKRVVNGWAGVSPNRGTLKVPFRLIGESEGFDFFLEHRINAAFPPYVRSTGDPKETQFRKEMWHKHTAVTSTWMQVSINKGVPVIACGDLNTPHNVKGYDPHVVEVGDYADHHFDRIGSHGFDLSHEELLSNMRSDHPRLRAVAKPSGAVIHNWHVVTDAGATDQAAA